MENSELDKDYIHKLVIIYDHQLQTHNKIYCAVIDVLRCEVSSYHSKKYCASVTLQVML